MARPAGLLSGQFLDERTLRDIPTPAFVYSEECLRQLSGIASEIRALAGCRVLYAVKALTFAEVLQLVAPGVDGFAVSSLFEAKLVRQLFPSKVIHITTPGLRTSEVEELSTLCDYVSLNSISQLERHGPQLKGRVSLGLRLNTGLSYIEDEKYDPCRLYSKLGVPLSALANFSAHQLSGAIQGLHIHTNADSTCLGELRANVDTLAANVPSDLKIDWINLGGGYLFNETESFEPLVEVVKVVQERFNAEVFLEPGAALVRSSVILVSEVIDLFAVDGKMIAVLDTTVNHMPEVLEFDYHPDVLGQINDGPYEYLLAGSTCLAGDIFGTYRFRAELCVGARVVFEGFGAYTLVKAHRFNGVNLPTVCSVNSDGLVSVRKQYTFQDFAEQWLPNA